MAASNSGPDRAPSDRRTYDAWSTDGRPSVEEILARISDGFVALDREWRFTYANHSAQRLLQRPAQTLYGTSLWSVFPELEPGNFHDACVRSLDSQVPAVAEAYIGRLDRWLGVRLYPSPSGMSLFFDDETELRRSQNGRTFLLGAGVRLAAFLDPARVAETAVTLAVQYAANWAVVDASDGAGSVRVAVGHAHAEDAATADAWRARPSAASVNELVASARTSGAPQHLANCPPGALLGDSAGDPASPVHADLEGASVLVVPLISRSRTLGTLTLVRRRRRPPFSRADEELMSELARRVALSMDNATLYGEAKAALAARDEMLGIVSHDLRNPLSTIQMAASMLRDDEQAARPEAVHKWGAMIQRSVSTMQALIGDLLDMTRVESGGVRLDARPYECQGLLEEAAAAQRALATDAGIALELRDLQDAPAVRSDRRRTMQVLANLIGNAIKFTPAGGRVALSATRDGTYVRFSVHDTGAGIAPGDLEAVFGRFWQATGQDARGIGLGLSIAHSLVEMQGGRIWVESQLGIGSTFHFTLPIAAEAADQERT